MNKIWAAIVAVLMVVTLSVGATAAINTAVPNPDPCQSLTGKAYSKCRFDRLENKVENIGSTATVTATATITTPTQPTTTPTANPVGQFPTASTAGVPAGWTPTRTVSGEYRVTTEGAVVENIRVNGYINVLAKNVTIRNVEVNGSILNFASSTCATGLKLLNVTLNRAGNTTEGVVSYGGYTADRVKINGSTEGFRVGAASQCGAVSISNSWVSIDPPSPCGDWHGDGLQGYDGGALTLKNSVMILNDANGTCFGTAPFFYPSGQGNTRADVDGLVVKGGGFPFRLGTAGSVKNLHIVENSWAFGPIAVNCGALSSWQASISRLDSNGQPVVVRAQPCNTSDGS